jgi:hypothetical protein
MSCPFVLVALLARDQDAARRMQCHVKVVIALSKQDIGELSWCSVGRAPCSFA